jgi:hypothetical protein
MARTRRGTEQLMSIQVHPGSGSNATRDDTSAVNPRYAHAITSNMIMRDACNIGVALVTLS